MRQLERLWDWLWRKACARRAQQLREEAAYYERLVSRTRHPTAHTVVLDEGDVYEVDADQLRARMFDCRRRAEVFLDEVER